MLGPAAGTAPPQEMHEHVREQMNKCLPPAELAFLSLALVEKFTLDISGEESQQLAVKYDLKNNGRFAYCDFIQSCVLLLKAKKTSLMQRMQIQNAHKMVRRLTLRTHAGLGRSSVSVRPRSVEMADAGCLGHSVD